MCSGKCEWEWESGWAEDSWQEDDWQGPEASTLDLGALDSRDEINAVGQWTKMNLDTGAAVTVFPEDWCSQCEAVSGNGVFYKTASGEQIEDKGQACFEGTDEYGIARRLKGRLTGVHKGLASASAMAEAGGQDFYLGSDGGFAVSRKSALGQELRKAVRDIVRRHGARSVLPIYVERGVFNFYLQKTKVEPVASDLHQKEDLTSCYPNGSRQVSPSP